MSKKLTIKKSTKTFSLPEEVKFFLQQIAEERQMKLSKLITEILVEWVDKELWKRKKK